MTNLHIIGANYLRIVILAYLMNLCDTSMF